MSAERLTKRQAAIIGLFTGVVAGPFADVQEYAEELSGGPVWTHELAFHSDEFQELARDDFLAICHERPAENGTPQGGR